MLDVCVCMCVSLRTIAQKQMRCLLWVNYVLCISVKSIWGKKQAFILINFVLSKITM